MSPDITMWMPRNNGTKVPYCAWWKPPQATPEQLAALDCPGWCDGSMHEVDAAGDGSVDPTHYRDLGGQLSLGITLNPERGDTAPRIHFSEMSGSDLELMPPAVARQLAGELLNAADKAEGC